MQGIKLFAAVVVAAAMVGCGGGSGGSGGSSGGNNGGGDPPPPPAVNVAIAGSTIVKVRSAGGSWAAMTEKLRRIDNIARPDRRLLLAPGGVHAGAGYTPPDGWLLIDFAMHPSQQISLVLANDHDLRLVRLNRDGQALSEFNFADPQVADDPVMDSFQHDLTALVPRVTRDAVRLAAIGEDLAIALRTGGNAVVAYRYRHVAGGFDRVWRTLVEPGVMIGNLGIIGGTFDPYSGLDNHWRLVMDASADGRVAIAVNVRLSNVVEGHAMHFNEPLEEMSRGVLVTALSAAGQRISTTPIPTVEVSEVHAIRWVGDRIAVGGRVYTDYLRSDGWNGYVGIVRPDGRQLVAYNLIDVEGSDVILDLAPLADGRLLASGSTNYAQNPSGGSISENASPLLAVLEADGRFRQRLTFAAGPRQNQVRTLAPWRGGWIAGGMVNGPGTHSADGDPALLFADGFVRETAVPAQ